MEHHSGKAAAGVEKLRAAAEPALVTVDRSRLPWHSMEPGFGTDPYVVAVARIDGDTVYVDDSGLYTLSVADFGAAWSASPGGSGPRWPNWPWTPWLTCRAPNSPTSGSR